MTTEGAMYDDPLDELREHAPAIMAALEGKPEPCLVIPDACRCGDLIDRRGSFHVLQGIPYCSKCFSRMAANGGRVPEHFATNTGEP